MNEADVVLALDAGDAEEEVTSRYGLTFEQLDEIMEAHNYKKCPGCGLWWMNVEIPDEYCPDCEDSG